jgi:predicted metal-binding membrane protein
MDNSLAASPENRASFLSERAFLGISALLFILSVAGTIYSSGAMTGMAASTPAPMSDSAASDSAMASMPGMSMPDQPQGDQPQGNPPQGTPAASFMAMWLVMMVAMMLPSLVPTLLRYRRALRSAGSIHIGIITALAGASYFAVWAVFGIVVYLLTLAVTAAATHWMGLAQSTPLLTGIALLVAGVFQLTAWKAHQLVCCRDMPVTASAWKYGLRLGLRCSLCCVGFMLILVVIGMMNLAAMALVAAGITIERLAPKPERIVRAAGILILVTSVVVIVQSLRMS